MGKILSTDALFDFDIPKLWDQSYMDYILCSLEEIAMCAFYLNGNDQMGLAEFVQYELDTTIEEYNPNDTYEKCIDELFDLICGYNYFIETNDLSDNQIRVVVDDDKTKILRSGETLCSEDYYIYKVENIA